MNIEKYIIGYLNEHLPEIHVGADVPNPRPDECITVERTGGSADRIVLDHPQITLQCWAKSRAEAADLADKADHLMLDMDGPSVPVVERNSLYNYPDSRGNPRYQIVYDIIAYR